MSIPRRVTSTSHDRRAHTHVGGERRAHADDAIRYLLRSFDIELVWSPSVVIGLFGLVMVWSGFVVAGLVGALTVGVALLGAGLLLPHLATRRRITATQHVLPEACLRMATVIRSGRPLDCAVVDVASEMDLVSDGLAALAHQVEVGRPVSQALQEWATTSLSSAERMLSAAMVLGVEQGGDLAHALDAVGEGIRDDLELAARRRVLLVQATMSATVLVLLPVVFALVASMVRGGLVFQGSLGAVLLAGGVGLDVLGCLWMWALMRGLR